MFFGEISNNRNFAIIFQMKAKNDFRKDMPDAKENVWKSCCAQTYTVQKRMKTSSRYCTVEKMVKTEIGGPISDD